jgi:hypothetical protein
MGTVQTPVPASVDAVVLLGWMAESHAVAMLTDPVAWGTPMTQECARQTWAEYRARVEALPEREAIAPVRLPITGFHEQEAIKEFRRRFKGAANILDVIRIDPMGLVVHQLLIVLDRSNTYAAKTSSVQGWLKHALLCDGPPPPMNVRAAFNAIDVEIPHSEFVFGFHPNTGFGPQQLARHVNATAFNNRLMLWAGYHRSYARMLSMAPDAIDRSLVVALTADGNFKVSPASPNQGEREMLTGARPPLFSDFFTDGFFMKVKLRKKRYELQIRANIVAIDAP